MEELLHNLGIDWKLLLAQIGNFIVLLIILRVFAYKPVLKLMHERSHKIEKGVKDAEAAAKVLKEAETKKEEAVTAGRKEAVKIVDKAAKEAEDVRAIILKEAKGESDQLRKQAMQQIKRDRDQAFASVQQELGELVVLASKRLTREAISPEAHRELIKQALSDIKRTNE
jgi:F-type H+-transporting ATPase subunit b